MKQFKKLLVMMMVMTLALGLAGCGKKDSNNNSSSTNVENSQTENSATETPTEAPTQESTEVTYPVEVTDSNGRVVTIEAKPEKIVSVAPNMTELVYELGEGATLVGRTDYCDYPEEAMNVASIGTMSEPNMEAIIELEPDLVLVSTHFSDENVTKLEELGIKVMFLYEETEIYGVYTMIETLGTVLNQKEKANAMVEEMKATFADIESKVAGKDRPTVYYVVSYGEYGDFTATGDTFINGLITLAGGDNIAKDATGWSYTLESLLEADPDIIVMGEGMSADFKTAENYSELTAVKEGRVYEMDSYHLLDRQGYRNAEGVKELAKIFYPDAIQ